MEQCAGVQCGFGGAVRAFGPGVVGDDGAGAGYVMFDSIGYSIVYGYGVRPVVYLKSDITVEELTISESGTEEEWTTETGYVTDEALEYGQISE